MPETDTFKFTHKTISEKTGKPVSKTYTLPPARDSSRKVPGWVVQDAIMHPDSYPAQVRLSLYALEASKASAEAKAALGEMESGEMLEVIDDWMGESARSSQ